MELAQGAGIASGLLEGIQSAMQMQNMLQEQALKKKMANAQTLEAMGKLAEATTPEFARQQFQKMGLVAPDQAQPRLLGPSPSTGGASSDQSAQSGNQPGQQMGMAQPNDPLAMPTYEQFKARPNAYGKMAWNTYGTRYKHDVDMQDPFFKAQFDKEQAGAKNAQNEQYNKGAEEFAKPLQEMTSMTDAYKKGEFLRQHPSPQAYNTALLAFIREDSPGQVPGSTTLEHIAEIPSLNQKYKDKLAVAFSGHPTKESMNDLADNMDNMFAVKYKNFKDLQSRGYAMAKERGVGNASSYLEIPNLDKYGKTALSRVAKQTPYQQTSSTGLLGQIFPNQFGAAKDIGTSIASAPGNLLDKAKGLISGNQNKVASRAETIPGSIDPKDRAMMESEIKRNPKSAASQHFMQALKIYK